MRENDGKGDNNTDRQTDKARFVTRSPALDVYAVVSTQSLEWHAPPYGFCLLVSLASQPLSQHKGCVYRGCLTDTNAVENRTTRLAVAAPYPRACPVVLNVSQQ